VTAVDLSLDSEWVACGHQGGQLVIWDIQSGKQIKSILDAHQQALVTVKFIEAKNRLLTADLKVSDTQVADRFITASRAC
jgi:WD40 repeat protein